MLQKAIKIILFVTFCQLTLSNTYAQLCNGSLGDPVVNIDFGSGASLIGPPLPIWTTNYSYVTSNGPSDGSYTITRTGSSGAANSWHELLSDHTGNANGYFMLVNASDDPGIFYQDTIHGLCGNTTYEFAAWLLNLLLPNNFCGSGSIKPNITFRIEKTDGTVLQTFDTGDLPMTDEIEWKQYGFFFTTQPNMQTVIVTMINNAPGGCGNDLAIDDITFRPCGRQLSSFIAGNNTTAINLCPGIDTTIQLLSSLSPGSGTPVYQWQESTDSGATWTDITNATTGSYTLHVVAGTTAGKRMYRLTLAKSITTAPSCRTASNTITLDILSPPSLSVSGNNQVCTGSPLTITATTTSTLQWKGPDHFTASQNTITIDNAAAVNAGKYYATIAYGRGCSYTDSSFIATVYPLPQISANPPSPVCTGSPLTLSVTAADAIQWTGPDNFIASQNPVTIHSATAANAGKYYATATSDKGCRHTDSSIIAIVYALPEITTQGLLEVCTGDPFAITATATDALQWKGPGGFTAAQTTIHIDSATAAYTGKYYATAVSDKGCRHTDSSLIVMVDPLPAVSTNGPDGICTGSQLILTANTTAAVQWKGPGNFSSSQPVATINPVTRMNQGRYYATARSDKGCRQTDSSLNVAVYLPPEIITNEVVEICLHATAQLEAQGGLTYQWSPSLDLSDAQSSSPTASPASNTTYYVTASDARGCKGVDSVHVIVNALPVANAGADQEIANGHPTQLNGSIQGGQATWYWTPDSYISNNQSLSPIVSPPSDTIYVLHATTMCGTATDSVFIKVYRTIDIPNAFSPNGDGIHDTWEIPALQTYPQAEVQVFGRYGSRVFYSKGYTHPWNGTYNNKPVPAGPYYYLIDVKEQGKKFSGIVIIL